MYLGRFNLREEPFGVTPDPRFLYLGSSHREALASLLHGIQTGRGFMLLVAQPGMGKTTLLADVLRQTRGFVRTVSLFQTQCTRVELLRYMLVDSGVQPAGHDVVTMHEQFNELLIRNDREGKKFVVFIDEAQNLSDEVLESIRLLSDFETPQRKLLQIILAGQPQLASTLSRPEQSQLRQRISIISWLKPLSQREVHEYIQSRLAVAGRTAPLFTVPAVNAIASLSGGIPRIINNYCFNLLSLACALGQKMVDEKLVDEVRLDLDVNVNQTNASSAEGPRFSALSPAGQQFVDSFRVLRDPSQRREETSAANPAVHALSSQAAAGTSRQPTIQRAYSTVSKGSGTTAEPFRASSQPASAAPRVSAAPRSTYSRLLDTYQSTQLADVKELADVNEDVPQTASTAPQAAPTDAEESSANRWTILVVLALLALGAIGWRVWNQPRLAPVTQVAAAKPTENTTPPAEVEAPTAEDEPGIESQPKESHHVSSPRTATVPADKEAPRFVANGSIPAKHSTEADEIPSPQLAMNVGASDEVLRLDDASMPRLAARVASPVVPGTLIKKVVPKYPAGISHPNDTTVGLTATVGESGRVENVQVTEGAGALAQSAASAVREWRYTPFTVNGVPVRATTHVVFKFKP
jgi:general secretion pathway protein A